MAAAFPSHPHHHHRRGSGRVSSEANELLTLIGVGYVNPVNRIQGKALYAKGSAKHKGARRVLRRRNDETQMMAIETWEDPLTERFARCLDMSKYNPLVLSSARFAAAVVVALHECGSHRHSCVFACARAHPLPPFVRRRACRRPNRTHAFFDRAAAGAFGARRVTDDGRPPGRRRRVGARDRTTTGDRNDGAGRPLSAAR